MRQVFSYRNFRGTFMPLVRVRLTVGERSAYTDAYVDSGASFSIFASEVAEELGVDLYEGKLVYVMVGSGAEIPVYLHRLTLGIGWEELSATIGFSEELGVGFNLLGRKDVFDQLEFCFHDAEKKLLVISEG
jgi:predicted aspartyl protease